ncbi:MAG: hypothetical protein IJW82_01985 [Clostridia bacterium]|nr:hypothetical protein [Clostridia bacterium]
MKSLIAKIKETYTGRDVIIALQHMLTMIGATILVPITCGLNVSMTVLCAGIGTIIFFFISEKKVPVFLGSSFAFLGAYKAIMGEGAPNGPQTLFTDNYELWCQNMGKLSVALMAAGVLYLLFSILVKIVGVEKIKKAFPPIVVGPIVMLIGFILVQSMFQNDIIGQISSGVAPAWKVWTCAIVTVVTVLAINAYCKPKSILKIMPVICGFFVGTVYAWIIGYPINIEFSGSIVIFQDIFTEKSILGFYRYLSIDLNAMVQVLPVALVSIMEHMGDISANSMVCGKDFMVDPGINKTILGDGTATFVAGMLGGPSNTTYSENTAVLVMTNNFKATNTFLAAIFAVILGIFVPFADIIYAIPTPVIGGASIVLFGMISASGFRNLIDNRVDLGKTKNLLVVSFTVAVGLGVNSIGNLQFGKIQISALCVATLVGILLNFVIPNDKEENETNEPIKIQFLPDVKDDKEETQSNDKEEIVTQINTEIETVTETKTEETVTETVS